MERENLRSVAPPASMGSVKGEVTSGSNREGESTDAERQGRSSP